ncbi:MAG: sigma-54 dependent transcriptional regulator [Bacteroidales bacterium]|jgi:two-component system, NtrC family, nitrogen regulation response regulator NtrX|nr:sigma-54 dependent transcriptional regulator [Bacteroidales bacterium]MDD2204313.1 sigma-54 dependent transcriptional regulator [Bacteroidales bacterium]MDD3151756.1 sigma-54 dependent transcriptional regulator [Bacteroidales bacterium]MDD3913194.1 sigma-54 dependent transcriptional regulator [Bacteroidales bacterium]MDD4633109.1 sigma-54 dependent transcriptional regulator [Bacteroidales bacterium]
MSKGKILIIDDEASIRRTIKEILEFEEYSADTADNGLTALEIIRSTHYDLIFCDVKMPGIDGIEFLREAVTITDAPIVMISGHGTIETAVEAIKDGAYDYIAKPLDLNRLLITVKNALDKTSLVAETKVLKQKIFSKHEIIGESEEIIKVIQLIDKVAVTDARVLITGENGTGKELVAHQIHEKSQRNKHSLIEVNCAAIPSELIESQLFGHEKGSFTSAIKQRKGDFELANGGTLFLDEIGDMSLSAQAKVLRALQENKIMRVGGEKEINVDVRVIAATNKNLKQEIEKGNFREDLYHRLSVIVINVPPLRNRKSDIPLLANHFLLDLCSKMGKQPITFTEEALQKLTNIEWRGNVRELHNVVERLIILCDKSITAKDVDNFANPFI